MRTFIDSITGRLLGASCLIALLVGLAFATLTASVEDLRDAAAREARAKEVTVAVVGLEKLVVDLESGVRGYALTGDRRFLQPYLSAKRVLPARLREFRELTVRGSTHARRPRTC